MEKTYLFKILLSFLASFFSFPLGIFVLRSKGVSPKGSNFREMRPDAENPMLITSEAFGHGEMIPKKYTCEGENVSPPLELSNVPENAQSLALIMHDPDASFVGGWTHWIVFNIDPSTMQIFEDSVPPDSTQGLTSFGKSCYGGPCPPSGIHHYEIKLYALDSMLMLDKDATKIDLEHAMIGHILQQSTLIGLYRL